MKAAWVPLLAVALLLLVLGLPPTGGALVGHGPELPLGPWGLWYAAGPLWRDGLHTTLLDWPLGGRIWPAPLLEGVLLAPVTWAVGASAAWNLLVLVRVAAAGLGGALLFRRLGHSAAWGLGLALSPALLQAVVAGEAAGPAVAWAPLAVVLLARGGWLPTLAAALLLATSPATGLVAAGLLLVVPGSAIGAAFLPWAVLLAVELWTAAPGSSLGPAALWSGLAAEPGRVGALEGVIGLGAGRTWGGPLLLGALLALRPGASPQARRGLLLVGIGICATLGPALVVGGQVARLGGRPLLLPLALIDGLPPISLCRDLAVFSLLAWAGALVVLAEGVPHRLAPLLLVGLVFGPRPGWTTPPGWPEAPGSGPLITWPLHREPWAMLAQTVHGRPISEGPMGPAPALEALVNRPAWKPTELQAWAREGGYEALVIDTDATWGQALELEGVLGGPVAMVATDWPPIILREHSFLGAMEVPPPPLETPAAPADWTWQDPVLAPLFDPTWRARARTRLQLYSSEDGVAWQPLDGLSAHSLTTLGLSVVKEGDEDAALLISGLTDFASELGEALRGERATDVVVLASTDLTHWGARRYLLDAAAAVVDPQVTWTPQGLELFAWTSDRMGVDPMLVPGDHVVQVAKMGASGRFEPGPGVYSGPRLADPTPAGDLLYTSQIEIGATMAERVRIARWRGDHYADVGTLEGVSVPFAWQEPEGTRIFVHGYLPDGPSRRFATLTAWSTDGVDFGPFEEVTGLLPDPCESPVGARFQGQWVLVCSHRPKPAD